MPAAGARRQRSQAHRSRDRAAVRGGAQQPSVWVPLEVEHARPDGTRPLATDEGRARDPFAIALQIDTEPCLTNRPARLPTGAPNRPALLPQVVLELGPSPYGLKRRDDERGSEQCHEQHDLHARRMPSETVV